MQRARQCAWHSACDGNTMGTQFTLYCYHMTAEYYVKKGDNKQGKSSTRTDRHMEKTVYF